MIPFDGLLFFYMVSLLVIPIVILKLNGKKTLVYSLIVNIFMIFMIFYQSKKQLVLLVLFYLLQLVLVKSYLKIREKNQSRFILWIMIFISLSPLILVKYGHVISSKPKGFFGFLGVSYLSFKAIQMLIEIYDGLISEVKILDFTYFMVFFPTISSGPIDRSRRFVENISKDISGDEYKELMKEGILKIFLGILYKFVFGAIIYNFWLIKIPADKTILTTISYMYGYSFYLFFDFAGYSAMAIGLSYIMGIRTPDNFNLPFISKDIKDFWNRWHMSLSFWFRDYFYTRFVMAALKGKWFKNRFTASYIGFILIMTTMGIWHGSESFYVIYGLYHGILIVLTDYYQRKSKFHKKNKKKAWYNCLTTFVTFNLVCFGFLIFSGYMFK